MAKSPFRVTVRVPATCANLGSGFDNLGIAIGLWNQVTVYISPKFTILNSGSLDISNLPTDKTNVIYLGAKKAFDMVNIEMPDLTFECINHIPITRGLGSSSAACIAGFTAGVLLCNFLLSKTDSSIENIKYKNKYDSDLQPLAEISAPYFISACKNTINSFHSIHTLADIITQVACQFEGHPDNAMPAIWGGMQLGYCDSDNNASDNLENIKFSMWNRISIDVPLYSLSMIVFIPLYCLDTAKARDILPKEIPRQDAIFNSGRLAAIISIMSSAASVSRFQKDYEALTPILSALKEIMKDKIHQPYREILVPHMRLCIDAAIEHGAYGACLSGAGPSILAICKSLPTVCEKIAIEMENAAKKVNINGNSMIFQISPIGVQISMQS